MPSSIRKAAGRLAAGKPTGKAGSDDKSTVGKLKGKATARKAKRQVRSLR